MPHTIHPVESYGWGWGLSSDSGRFLAFEYGFVTAHTVSARYDIILAAILILSEYLSDSLPCRREVAGKTLQ